MRKRNREQRTSPTHAHFQVFSKSAKTGSNHHSKFHMWALRWLASSHCIVELGWTYSSHRVFCPSSSHCIVQLRWTYSSHHVSVHRRCLSWSRWCWAWVSDVTNHSPLLHHSPQRHPGLQKCPGHPKARLQPRKQQCTNPRMHSKQSRRKTYTNLHQRISWVKVLAIDRRVKLTSLWLYTWCVWVFCCRPPKVYQTGTADCMKNSRWVRSIPKCTKLHLDGHRLNTDQKMNCDDKASDFNIVQLLCGKKWPENQFSAEKLECIILSWFSHSIWRGTMSFFSTGQDCVTDSNLGSFWAGLV